MSQLSIRVTQLVAILYLLLLSWLTLAPDPWGPLFGGHGREVETTIDTTLADAAQHAGAYGLLGFLLLCAAVVGGIPSIRFTVAAALLHAVATECIQGFVPLRTCDWTDAVSNVTGVAAGAALANVLGRSSGVSGTARQGSPASSR